MKNRKIILMMIPVLLLVTGIVFFTMNSKDYKIGKVLKNENYSYLPQEAKDYIKNVYKESGVVILTEKNKEENTPYLNPKYVDYLQLSAKEKKNVELIPEVYSVDYDYTKLDDLKTYESSYSLENDHYLTPLKDQDSLGICWAFTAAEQAESLVMVQNHQAYDSNTKQFSPRQMDYALSTDGIKNYNNEYGITIGIKPRTLGGGGNFFMATDILASGLSLINESTMPFNTSYAKKEASQVFSFTNSNYEVNQTASMPSIAGRFELDYLAEFNECNDDIEPEVCINQYYNQLKASYINKIKEGIKTYGGAFVSTVSPQGMCSFINTTGDPVVEEADACYNSEEGHAMQVIGWDDNYSYQYCRVTETDPTTDNNFYNTSTVNGNCSSGTKVTGTGAFILRNSWGDNDWSYPYLTYDSITDSSASATFDFITNMSETSSRSWDNVYKRQLDYTSGYIWYDKKSMTQTFTKKVNSNEKLEKVKFAVLTDGEGHSYSVTIKDGNHTYSNLGSTEITFPGTYTIDLSSENIVLENSSFDVTINASPNNSKALIVRDTISAFTSNVSETPVVKRTGVENLAFDTPQAYSSRIVYNTKNIASGENLNLSLKTSTDVDVSNYLTVSNKTIAANNANVSVVIDALPIGDYKLVASYGDSKDEMPISVGTGDTAQITYYANNGTDESVIEHVEKNTLFSLTANTFTKTRNTFKEWNTKADGTGTSYENEETMIDGISGDLVLYAQWDPESYTITFDSNGGSGNMSNQTVYYGEQNKLSKNTYSKTGYTFAGWNTEADGTGASYEDEEVVSLDFTEDTTLYAQWSPKQYRVVFDSNGGSGEMEYQTMTYDQVTKLNPNTFTRTGYTFKSWNRLKNGQGQSYNNESNVLNLTANPTITLYAQWEANEYEILYKPNGGVGEEIVQMLYYDQVAHLLPATYTMEDHVFKEWNTEMDGSGDTYTDEQEVLNLTADRADVIILYAQYELSGAYEVTFHANDGTTAKTKTVIKENVPTNLVPNTFTRTGYTFDHWNTKADGSGTSYNDEAEVTLTADLDLYAQWRANTYTVTFNANGGVGDSYSQNFSYGETKKLSANIFVRESHLFTGWNTEPDGSGTPYTDKQEVSNLTDVDGANINLYAQYMYIEYVTVTYHSNYEPDTTKTSDLIKNYPTKLAKNTFTRSTYVFDHWNTEPDNSGTSYTDEQSVTASGDLVLYAQWRKANFKVSYKTHVQGYGWQDYVSNGAMSGTSGEAKRLEGIKIKLENQPVDGDIEYRTHIQGIGWEKMYKKNDEMSGTSGQAKRLEAIQIRLTGEMSVYYDVYYRVHAQGYGWLGWARNDEQAGSEGYSKRLEAIEIIIVEKGTAVPGYGDEEAFITRKISYRTHVQGYGWQDYVSNGEMSGTSGEAKRLEAIQIMLDNPQYEGDIEYRTHIQGIGWEQYYRKNNEVSGTSGQAKRLEAIQIKLTGEMSVHYDIYYRVHAQYFGWLAWAKNDEKSGTAGFGYRLEAIEIALVPKGKQPPARTNQNNDHSFIEA